MIQFTCPWCNHLVETDVEHVKPVQCTKCGKWAWTSDEKPKELPTCSKCGEKMHSVLCSKCLPKF